MGYADDLIEYLKKEHELDNLGQRIQIQEALGGSLAEIFSGSSKDSSSNEFLEKLMGKKNDKTSAGDILEKNAIIQSANSAVRIRNGTSYGQLYPKYTMDGTLPKDFGTAKTFAELNELSVSMIDKILSDYNLTSQGQYAQFGWNNAMGRPRNLNILQMVANPSPYGQLGAFGGTGLSREKEHKLQVLVEFLGADYEQIDILANLLGKNRRT
ncbi:hypothetical protein PVAG01_09299 [Phlyctema vagabunda]|uniref:Uncharacterized protein n=1 Tax=Phlyctema vagabunda TaxID=108571 RepID=A0ABR4P710_9HELO